MTPHVLTQGGRGMSRGRRGRQQGSTKGSVVSRVTGTFWRDKSFWHEGRRFILWAHVLRLSCGHEIEVTADRTERWRDEMHPSKKVCQTCTNDKDHARRQGGDR